MDPETRFAELERAQEAQAEGQKGILLTLNKLLERVTALNTRSPTPIPIPAPEPSPEQRSFPFSPSPPSPSFAKLRPKAAAPDAFDGDRTKGRAFLTSCQLYLKLCDAEFRDDQARIHWVLSYMKSGRAATFANRTLRTETRTGKPCYRNWEEFMETLENQFCPENEVTHARMRLESSRYFQGRRTVDAYIDEFVELVDVAGCSDPASIVLKFRRGLSTITQDKIAESEIRPDDADPSAWYEAAKRLDQNRLANEAFHHGDFRKATPATGPVPYRGPGNPGALPHTSATPAPPPSTSSNRTRFSLADGKYSITCYRCGKTGHTGNSCPHNFDIRYMTTDERQSWLEELLAAADVAMSRQVTPTVAETPEEVENAEEAPEEDFVTSSG
jgi:hypothetical protein